MVWFLLIIACFLTFRVYAKWLGYYRLLTKVNTGSDFDTLRDWSWQPKITFMIPSFNEGAVVCEGIESILASNYPRDKIEIIGVDDCSHDDTFKWLVKMQEKYPNNVVVWRNNPNKGKPMTLIDIAQKATGEILFTVDSDTIIDPGAIKEIISCYADPEIGGVCGFILCKNLNDSVWTKMQGMFFVNYYYFTKGFENQFRTSRVLCGQLTSFRTSLFRECIPLLKKREIFGLKDIRCAEDTYITHLICMGNGLKKRWKCFNNFDARAYTNQPATMIGYLKQQLRWWRSISVGWTVMFDLWRHIHRAGVMPVIITTITVIANLSIVFTLLYLYSTGMILPVFSIILLNTALIKIVSCYLYNYLFGRHNKIGGEIKNPIFVGIWAGMWSLAIWTALSIISLFTLDDGGWVTRQNGDGNIIQK